MAVNPRYKNGHRRRQLRQRLATLGQPCGICGGAIDYTLPPGHPLSFEVDEVTPVSRGGDPLDFSNVQAAHRICNQRKGARTQFAQIPRPISLEQPNFDFRTENGE